MDVVFENIDKANNEECQNAIWSDCCDLESRPN